MFTKTSDNHQGDSNKKDIIDFNINEVIKELNDSLNCDYSKNQAVKRNINTSVNANTDNIYRNSNTMYDRNFVQNPVNIISDELMCVEAVSSDDVRCCKVDVEIITDNQLNHVCKEKNADNNNFVCNSQVNNNYGKSNVNSEISCNRNNIYDFNLCPKSRGWY